MSIDVQLAERNLARADRAVRVGKWVFIGYVLGVSIFLIVQLIALQQGQERQLRGAQDALSQSLADNEEQHRRTQLCIRSVADALKVPVAQRTDSDLDACGLAIDRRVSGEGQNEEVQIIVVPQAEGEKFATQEPASAADVSQESDGDVNLASLLDVVVVPVNHFLTELTEDLQHVGN